MDYWNNYHINCIDMKRLILSAILIAPLIFLAILIVLILSGVIAVVPKF